MARIIITLTNRINAFSYDLEAPTDLECHKLIDDIVQTIISYNPDLSYNPNKSKLFLPKLNSYISPYQTLEDAGVYNGDYLIIE